MLLAATWVDLETVILSEVSQTEKEKYWMTSFKHKIWKEMILMNLLTRETQRFTEWTYGCQRENEGKG